MKPAVLLSSLVFLSVPLFSACAGPDRSSEAGDLREVLSELSGVSDVSLDYSKPVTLDSGKIALSVRMEEDASTKSVVEVVTTAYDAFSDAHQGEEGDLDIVLGDDVIHLRSFEAEADADDVAKAAAAAMSVLSSGAVKAYVNTQDVTRAPHVFTEYTLTVAESSVDAVLTMLADLEKAHGDLPDASWRVQAGDEYGWLIGSDLGFPDSAQVALFEKLAAGLAEGAVVRSYGIDFVTLSVPRGVTPDEVSATVTRHLELLGDMEDLFYDVESPEGISTMTEGDCYFDGGRIGARLELDHSGSCSHVTHSEAD
ncbi:hypothetical protein [Nocardioides alcanivorans]|uniref:hypothetical protein n=1 Tax=Nocardioides alcanivorans TaxID=2897352 RepID=UPI001F393CF6|nr:hypothetical protein [Nocardioides alcanivorans]